jgi:hypothetical protein
MSFWETIRDLFAHDGSSYPSGKRRKEDEEDEEVEELLALEII